MNEEHIPVLIVGGGIVGLSASLFLSYHGVASLLVERRPVGRVAAVESGAAADEHGLLSMRKSLPLILSFLRRIPRLVGYGYEYASQSIISDRTSSAPGIFKQLLSGTLGLDGRPGTRAPHVWVDYQGQCISTLDMFGKSFVLLAGPDGAAWCQAASTAAGSLGIDLITHCVGPAGDLLDQKSQWKSRTGISACGAILIRPDGFIAWRARRQPADIQQELEQILMHVLCRENIIEEGHTRTVAR